MNKFLFLALLLLLYLFTYTCYSQGIKSPSFQKKQSAYSSQIRKTTEILFNGSPATRFEVNKNDKLVSNSKRSEIVLKSDLFLETEYWYAFSIFLPNDYSIDSVPEILAQWHDVPDRKLGEKYRSPAISLRTNKGHWLINVMWATNPVNTNKTISGRKLYDLSSYEKGQWTSWIFHIKFSYKDDGLLQIWKNDTLVVNRHGPNYYNDKKGPYFKYGIYKWDWKNKRPKSIISKRIIYFSEIKIGDENQTFKSMNTSLSR